MNLLVMRAARRPHVWILDAGRAARLAWKVAGQWSQDRCSSMSAALAFYAAFSVAPMLMIIIMVASVFFGFEAVQGRLYTEIRALVGHDGAVAIQAMLASAWKANQGGMVGALSLLAIGVGASATFAELNGALNAIWKVPPPPKAMAALIRVRLTSFGLVVGTGFLVVVLLIADAAITFLTHLFLPASLLAPMVGLVQNGLSLAFLCVAFSVLLKILPDLHVEWHHAQVGGVTAAILFMLGKHVFALYLTHAGTANSFGAASSLAVLMMWLFFSAAVFLFGAELAAELSRRHKTSEELPALTHPPRH